MFEFVLSLLQDALPTFFAFAIAFVVIILLARQTLAKERIDAMNFYAGIQRQVYLDFIGEIGRLSASPSEADRQKIVSAAYKAAMVSGPDVSFKIFHFCKKYCTYPEHLNNPDIMSSFEWDFLSLSVLLRKELFRFDKREGLVKRFFNFIKVHLHKFSENHKRQRNEKRCDQQSTNSVK